MIMPRLEEENFSDILKMENIPLLIPLIWVLN